MLRADGTNPVDSGLVPGPFGDKTKEPICNRPRVNNLPYKKVNFILP